MTMWFSSRNFRAWRTAGVMPAQYTFPNGKWDPSFAPEYAGKKWLVLDFFTDLRIIKNKR